MIDRDKHKRHAVILTRISLDHLDRPAESLEYLSDCRSTPAWKPAPIRDDAADLVAKANRISASAITPKSPNGLCCSSSPDFASGEIGIRTADHLDGPWSPFRSLMNIPEMHTRQTNRKRIFCYAAKEHPSFESTPGTLIVTYACSSLHFKTLVSDMSIYRPIVTQLQIPAAFDKPQP